MDGVDLSHMAQFIQVGIVTAARRPRTGPLSRQEWSVKRGVPSPVRRSVLGRSVGRVPSFPLYFTDTFLAIKPTPNME